MRPRSTHPGWTDAVRVPCVVSPSRSHHRPVRREPSIDTRTIGTSANLSHIADITRRTRVSPAMISSTFRDVRTKSRLRLSDLCHMRYVRKSLEEYSSGSMRGAARVACLQIEAPSLRPSPALNGDKKRGRFSCLSRNDHRALLRLLLSDSYHLRTICCIPTRTAAAMHCVSAGVQCTRTQPKSTVVFRKPGFRPATPGDPWLCGPASRQVCLFVQPILGRKSFYTGSNLNWCRLNLIITQGRCVRSRKP